MTQNIFDIILIVGFIQGCISSSILFYRNEKSSNKYLAWIILLISLACLNIYLLNSFNSSSTLLAILSYCIPLVIVMPVGPLIYQFTLTHNGSSLRIPKMHYHLVWIDLIPSLLAILFFTGMAFGLFDGSQFKRLDFFIDDYNKYVDIPRWISLSLYTCLAYQYLRKNSTKNQKWAFHFLFGFLIFNFIWLLFLIPYLIPSFSDKLLRFFNWYPLYIPLVIMIYWLGLTALMQSKKPPVKTLVDKSLAKKTIEKLTQLMQKEEVYKDPLLRLDKIVALTNIPQKTISASLNQSQHKTFNEFVNEYRIKEVKEKLIDPSFKHLTITGIAFECGFNSQATFQRTFKNLTGESPSAYRARLSQKNTAQN